MATPKIIADFETQLATALAVGGTSFTLASGVDDDGTALPDGKYYFTIDNGTSQKEYVVGTLSGGTSVSSVSNVSRQGVESSGVLRAHRIGATVIMTDFLTYKNYIDETTTAGASDADAITKGLVEVATTAEIDADTELGSTSATLSISPDKLALSKYGLRLPTADEKAALAGGGDLGTPSTSNKFLTEDAVDSNTVFPPPQVVVFTSSGTWTKDAGLKYVIVEVVGGGGGGQTSGDDRAGGGAGGYSRKLISAASLGSTETVTVGAGGNTGSSGGTSSFGAHCSASGGTAGGSWESPGTGGVGSGGDINMRGGPGQLGNNDSGGSEYGSGGNSFFGGGGTGDFNNSVTGQANSGGGGNGGGSGGSGIVIVTEYYS